MKNNNMGIIDELWEEEKILDNYSKEQLQALKYIDIDSNIKEEQLKNMMYIKDTSILTIKNKEQSEEQYYKKILQILDQYNTIEKTFEIDIVIEKRKNFDKYLEYIKKYSNKNIRIKVGLEKYTISEYIEEKEKLDTIVKDIKNSDMTPLEKYMAVYNIVKKFKPYKENANQKQEAREIKYILNGEYIVCQGYSSLLTELLDRVDIESQNYSTTLNEEKNNEVEYIGEHARTIVNIKDEKYNINGYFIADATWDNNKNIVDTYDYALRPFESMQKTYFLFKLQPLDYILDNNTFGDFCTKINILLNKKLKENSKYKINFKQQLLYSYEYVFNEIKSLLKNIDIEEYQKLKNYINIDKNKRTEEFYEKFLTEIGHYIVNKTNKEIKPEIIAQAASTAKFYYEDIPDAFKLAYEDKIKREYKDYTYEIPDNDIYNQELKENEIKGRHI